MPPKQNRSILNFRLRKYYFVAIFILLFPLLDGRVNFAYLADFFHPRVFASCQSSELGDADCSGIIDSGDFNFWKDELTGVSHEKNTDFNQNGKVDLVDFEIWRRNTTDFDGLTPTPTGISENHIFGVMLGDVLSTTERLNTAVNLGAKKYRPGNINIQESLNCPDCLEFKNAGLDLILTVRNGGGEGEPSDPPADLNVYQTRIDSVLDSYKPKLLVVENEENSSLFYSGTPEEYHTELAAACRLAHSKNYQCTNGGLVSKEVVLLTGNNYYENGQYTQADNYFWRTMSAEDYQDYHNNPSLFLAANVDYIKKGKDLLLGYHTDGADFVNFHWYVNNAQALGETVSYLRSATGLNVMTNEMGQQTENGYSKENPNVSQVIDMMRQANNLGLTTAVWFSVDIPVGRRAYALNNLDGGLRKNGIAYQDFIRK